MEKRIGIVAILLTGREHVHSLNDLLSEYGDIICARLGLPFKEKHIHVISVVVEGTTDQIGAFTGKIGRLPGIQVKSVLTSYKEAEDDR